MFLVKTTKRQTPRGGGAVLVCLAFAACDIAAKHNPRKPPMPCMHWLPWLLKVCLWGGLCCCFCFCLAGGLGRGCGGMCVLWAASFGCAAPLLGCFLLFAFYFDLLFCFSWLAACLCVDFVLAFYRRAPTLSPTSVQAQHTQQAQASHTAFAYPSLSLLRPCPKILPLPPSSLPQRLVLSFISLYLLLAFCFNLQIQP